MKNEHDNQSRFNSGLNHAPDQCHLPHRRVSKKYRALFLLVAASVALAIFELPIASQCMNRGDTFFGAGMYRQSVRHYRKAIILSPKFADAYNWMAYAYERMEETDKAISIYERSFKRIPENDFGYFELGRLYFIKKNMKEKAQKYFQKAIEINPRNREAYIWLGVCYKKSGEKDKAISLYQQMLKVFPEEGFARKRLRELSGS